MSDGREVLVPFCQVIRMPANDSVLISLSGTYIGGADSGHDQFCNYISVEPVKTSDSAEAAPSKGYYQLTPSGFVSTGHQPYVNMGNNPSAITVSSLAAEARHNSDDTDLVTVAGTLSGAPAGAGAGVLGGPNTITSLSLNSANMVSSVALHSHFDTSCLMLVNYGVVQKSNPMRDGERFIGK